MNRSERFPLQRLLILGVLSAGAHLATLAWLDARAQRVLPRAQGAALALNLRLAGTAAPAAVATSTAVPAAPVAPASVPLARARRPAATAAEAAPAQASAPATDSAVSGAAEGADPALQMPGRYNVRVPPPMVLSFDVAEGPTFTPRAAPSRLIWQATDLHYSLRFEDVPDAYGGAPRTYTSEGGVNDGGIAPDSAFEQQEGTAQLRTSFEREANRIVLASGATAELSHSTQDSASLLMQLAGIGLANAGQISETVQFEVAAAGGPSIVRFDVGAQEQLNTPYGVLAAWHLTQQVKPGEIRLEVWLAPALNWYPVQLRTSGPNGVIAQQTLRSATAAQPVSPP